MYLGTLIMQRNLVGILGQNAITRRLMIMIEKNSTTKLTEGPESSEGKTTDKSVANSKKARTRGNRKRGSNGSRNRGRGTHNATLKGARKVKYIQKTKELEFRIVYPTLGGEGIPTPTSLVGTVDMSQLPHSEAMRMVSFAKLLSGFYNGHNITAHVEIKNEETGEIEMTPSPLEKVNRRFKLMPEDGNEDNESDKSSAPGS